MLVLRCFPSTNFPHTQGSHGSWPPQRARNRWISGHLKADTASRGHFSFSEGRFSPDLRTWAGQSLALPIGRCRIRKTLFRSERVGHRAPTWRRCSPGGPPPFWTCVFTAANRARPKLSRSVAGDVFAPIGILPISTLSERSAAARLHRA